MYNRCYFFLYRQQVKNLTFVQRKDIEGLKQILRDYRCEGCKQSEENAKNKNDQNKTVKFFYYIHICTSCSIKINPDRDFIEVKYQISVIFSLLNSCIKLIHSLNILIV